MHCWRILREEPKWNDRLLELNNTPPVHVADNGSPMQGDTCNETEAPVRPGGRDKAKKKRSNALVYIVQSSDSTSSSSHKSNAYRSGRRSDCGSPADEAIAALRPTRRLRLSGRRGDGVDDARKDPAPPGSRAAATPAPTPGAAVNASERGKIHLPLVKARQPTVSLICLSVCVFRWSA